MRPVADARPLCTVSPLPIARRSVVRAAVLLCAAVAGGPAAAAMLGPLSVFSSFGEPLRAVVEVVEVTSQTRPVAAGLASPQVYAELGVPFPRSLEGATVRLFQQPDGRWLIRISTQGVVDESDFNVVVSLTTDTAQQIRRYTLSSEATPGPSAQAPAAPAPEGGRGEPDAAAAATPPAATAAPLPSPSVPAVPHRSPDPSRPATVTARRGDTATAIARRIKPDDVSEEQAVMALYRANEAAFGGTVHRLAEGAVLQVPDAAAWRATDPRTARAALRAQPFVPAAPRAAAGPGADRLVLAGGGSGRATSKGGGGAGAATTAAIAFEAAMQEANSRIRELEAITAGLRQLVAAREQQIAAAERELAALRSAASASDAVAQREWSPPPGAAAATLIRLPASTATTPMPAVAGPRPANPVDASLIDRLLSPPVLGTALAILLSVAGGLVWRLRRRAARRRDTDPFTP